MSFENMPKVELHRHLELSLRHDTIRELAPDFDIKLDSESDFEDRFIINKPMASLEAALDKFLDTQLLWASEELIERLTFEVCEDAFREGIRVLELRYAPTFIKYRHDNLNFEKIHTSIVKGVQKAESAYPMAVGLICILQRILPINEVQEVTEFAINHKDTFVGLDLADNEEGFDSKPFAPFFLKAKEAGLGITIHAGEVDTPKSPRYPKDAVEHLGATRIGHGLHVSRDPEMMNYIKENNIVLELCPTSNYLTQSIPNKGELKDHPFKQLYDAGLKVTINTDDPGIFATDINQEYRILSELFGLSEQDFKKCNQTAFEASFIPEVKKSKVWQV